MDMASVGNEWIKKQLAKAVAAEESIISTEKEHRERAKLDEVARVYDRVIKDDEKHLDELKNVGKKYGYEAGGMMAGGGLLGSIKATIEEMSAGDPFQTIGNDLMMKSNAVNYDRAWERIFRQLGDEDSAMKLEQAAVEDEEHERLMRETLTVVGIREAQGEKIQS